MVVTLDDISEPQPAGKRGKPEWTFQEAAYVFLCAILPRDSEIQGNDAANSGGVRIRQLRAKRGIKSGWPDLTAAVLGFPEIYIECKARGGRLSAEQERRGQRLTALGRHWFVADTLVEIEAELPRLGVPLRATTLSAAERDARISGSARKPKKPRPRATQRADVAKLARLRAAGYPA